MFSVDVAQPANVFYSYSQRSETVNRLKILPAVSTTSGKINENGTLSIELMAHSTKDDCWSALLNFLELPSWTLL